MSDVEQRDALYE